MPDRNTQPNPSTNTVTDTAARENKQSEQASHSSNTRREFVKRAGVGAAAVGLLGAAACSEQSAAPNASHAAPAVQIKKPIKWKMVTTWPANFPGLGTGAAAFADLITRMSGGRLQVKLYPANELVPPFETFDAVSRGTAEMGHCAAYYWKGKSEAAQFFTAVPFGLTAIEMQGWLQYGGGMELWRELYDGFNLVPFDAGNTGVQMGGWYNKEINSLADMKGLKMRIPGLGGEVFKRAGGLPMNLPGGELFTALQTGLIDATEWVGPYNDMAFGLHKAAKYYYYPGWHEPGPVLEGIVNKDAWNELPEDLQTIIEAAAAATSHRMLAEYTARNNAALVELVTQHGVELRRYPDEVLAKIRQLSDEVVGELAEKDAFSKRVYDSYRAYRDNVVAYHKLSEQAYYNARSGG